MIRGSPVRTLVTVTYKAGASLLRIASMSTWAAIASRSGLSPSGLAVYGVSTPVDQSQAPTESRHLCSIGRHSSRAILENIGSAIACQNERTILRASAEEPFASALATMAALMAPALVPESCAMEMLRLASNASRTPQV